MAGYYAYTKIMHDDTTYNFGDKVSQSDLNMSDEEWQDLIDTNAVGEEAPPEDLGQTESLSQYHLRKANEAVEAVQAGELPKSTPKSSSKDESASSKS